MKSLYKKQILILSFALIIVMLGFGMVIPLMPFYIENLGASGKELGLLTAIYSLMQFLFSPVWGRISDRIGRKPVLLIGIIGNAVFLVLFGFATQLWILFLARILAGVLSSATLPTTMAYISDTTPKNDLGNRMGKLSAGMGLGVIIGPGLGGWFAEFGYVVPFLIAAGLSILAFVLVLTKLPESNPGNLLDAKADGFLSVRGIQNKSFLQGSLGILFLMAFFVSFGMTNFEGIFGLYTIEYFHFTPRDIGLVLVMVGLAASIVQGSLTGILTRRFGEVRIIKGAFVGVAAGFFLILFANDFISLLITSGLLIMPVALLRPAVHALIAGRTTVEQGTTMGISNAFSSLGRVVGPVCAGFLFDIRPSLPFIIGGIIMLIGFLISLLTLKNQVSH
jgi:DHA1 family multidrug resistance protein-like MFS transporter